jgi:hypothetical protein
MMECHLISSSDPLREFLFIVIPFPKTVPDGCSYWAFWA